MDAEVNGLARELLMFAEILLVVFALIAAQAEEPGAPRIRAARCVSNTGDLIRHSDVIAMRPEPSAETYRKYCIDIVAWGAGVGFDEESAARQRRLVEVSRSAGVRLHAVDLVAVSEGSRCVISGGEIDSPKSAVYGQRQQSYDDMMKRLTELGVDLNHGSVLDIHGNWVRVPWGGPNRNLPMASVYWPAARQWYMRKMETIAATGGTILHIDEPVLGSYGLVAESPGDFSEYAIDAFREWLNERPAEIWQEAGVQSLDDFNYRDFVLSHGGDARSAPLWREFVRFQLSATADFIREMRDYLRARTGLSIPVSMNANPSTWYKLALLPVQDLMTTEVGHEAKRLGMPVTPLLVYKFGDAIGQPVVTTAHGGEWHEMFVDPHPVLVCSWLAMGYALGHQLMMPVKAWMTPRVNGSDAYRPSSDHYACVAHFVKRVKHLLDGHEAISCLGVVLGCDAIQHDVGALKMLLLRLADMNVPFNLAVEGNDLFLREVKAQDLDGCWAVLAASPDFLTVEARGRIMELAGDRPVSEYSGGDLPEFLPRPIRVEGADRVWVLPRMVPGDESAPVAVHLLNRDYDTKKRQMRSKDNFSVVFDSSLFGGRKFESAVLHQPILTAELPVDGDVDQVTPLTLEQDGDVITLTVPGLDMWGIVEMIPIR